MTGELEDLPKAIAKGARKSPNYTDGTLIAILPSFDPSLAEDYADIAIATGLNQARNIIVANSDAVIAIGGGAGTLRNCTCMVSETPHNCIRPSRVERLA